MGHIFVTQSLHINFPMKKKTHLFTINYAKNKICVIILWFLFFTWNNIHICISPFFRILKKVSLLTFSLLFTFQMWFFPYYSYNIFAFVTKKYGRHCAYNHVMKAERMVGETINALGADELKRIAKEELGEDENKMKVGLPLLTISFPDKMLNSPRFPRWIQLFRCVQRGHIYKGPLPALL